MSQLRPGKAVAVFLTFAFAYFFSTLIRAITATLSPVLSSTFELTARDLGLLAGGYFLGFAMAQLPLGHWLDRFGPKRVLVTLLTLAVAGCLLFATATGFAGLLIARVFCGVGVSACLMAPLTGYRRWLDHTIQLRVNSWMLMTGSLGMLASTLPVQWLMPLFGWRILFYGLAGLLLVAITLIAWQVPSWRPPSAVVGAVPGPHFAHAGKADEGYAVVWRNPYFWKMVPIGFFCYGGLLAIQTLWAIPWMIKVAGFSALQASTGLFWINVAMLCAYWFWGWINPWLVHHSLHVDRLIALGLPVSFICQGGLIVMAGSQGDLVILLLVLYCVSSTFIALTQPAVALVFPAKCAGRALSAYNLVIFSGVFFVQWGIGLAIDGFMASGVNESIAFRYALGVHLLLCIMSYAYFFGTKSHNQGSSIP